MRNATEYPMERRADSMLRKYAQEGNILDHEFDPAAMISCLMADLMVLARYKNLDFDTILARAIKLSEP